jgi:site-specific DNA recombinase
MSAGGLSYGYTTEETPIGRRTIINPTQAETVKQVFAWLADGHSPRWVVARLNEAGIPSARGGTWAVSALVGSAAKGLGLINNQLYIGRVVWNRSQWLKDPDTGKRRKTDRPQSEWVTRQDESLRIIDQATWDAVQSRCTGRTRGLRQAKGRSPKTLFGGLLTCGDCGGAFIAVNALRYGCNTHKDRGSAVCSNSKTVLRETLDKRLVSVVRDELLSPWALDVMRREVRAILAEANSGNGHDFDVAQKRVAELDTKIRKLVDAVSTVGISPALSQALQSAEREKESLTRLLASPKSKPTEVVIADVKSRYKRMMLRLQSLLDDDADRENTRQMLAQIIGPVTLESKEDGTWAVLEEPAERLLLQAVGESLNVVAGAGFEPTTFGL